VPWLWDDEETALRGLISAGPATRAIEAAGEQATRDAVRTAIAPYRRPDGGYRLENEFVYLVAQAKPLEFPYTTTGIVLETPAIATCRSVRMEASVPVNAGGLPAAAS
jgi:hypothetical protein